jgi:uncharacterized protein DUF5985
VATWFPAAVYLLCLLTSATCALLLARNYRSTGARLLLWSALCFLLLAANHAVVMIDLLVLPAQDLRLVRYLLSLGAVGVLLFGFIWDLED